MYGADGVLYKDSFTEKTSFTFVTKTDIQGHLFGTSSHIEVGANLQFARETNQHMIMMTGTAILSE